MSSDPEVLRHGAYVCLRVPSAARDLACSADVPTLAERFGLQNEFDGQSEDPPRAVAFLRRVEATPSEITDDALLESDAIVHVAATVAEPVEAFCAEMQRLLPQQVQVRVVGGVVRPMSYTSRSMHDFAYARRVMQQPGALAPNAFLVPMCKALAWWAKDWMERHTFFLPRFDDAGRMLNQGHALAAEAGIACLMRRTYKHPTVPAPDGEYDFVSYFECADAAIPTFHEVCAALRDTGRNPEWSYVREGPTWHGRRVATWAELFN